MPPTATARPLVASVTGFTQREFDVFDLPTFQTRMPAIRAEITPRLKALGEQLAPRLEEATGREIHPHVAQHLRRTVNPPIETWAAFSPSARAYKPFIHLRVAINGAGVKVVCHLEEDSDDKETFAENLKRNAAALAVYLAQHPEIHPMVPRGSLTDAEMGRDKAALATLADRLARVKAQDASFSIAFPRTDPALATGDTLVAASFAAMRTLLPIYRLGVEAGIRL
jgi:uncharacterized protein YktB (UPF0637 family)